MSDPLIASLDFIGFLGFLFALLYSYKNFQRTRYISTTWLLLTVSMVFLALFTFLNSLEWMGVYPEIIDNIQNSLFPVAIVSLFTSVLVSRGEFLKPLSK